MKLINNIKLSFDFIKEYVYENINIIKSNINCFLIFIGLDLFFIFIFRFIYILNLYIFYYLYWFGLGLLSTIGLGSGIPTGLIFLIPYCLQIKELSLKCNHTNFNLIGNNKLECITYEHIKPSNNDIFIKILPTIVIWGIGTAFGEIPPFYLAKIAKSNEFSSNYKILQKFYNYTIYFINHYGFITILILSCWPSCTFDMCGLAAGYCNLNIAEFLIPTTLGKALIKTPIQIYSILFLFEIDSFTSTKSGNFNTFFNIFFIITVLYFCNSIINNLAQKQLNKIKL
jgi:vacuole membrane protein 1